MLIALEPHRQHHVGEVLLVVHGGQDDGAQAVGQLQGDLLAGHSPQGIGEIPDIEADLQLLAVAGDGALILGGADGGVGAQHQHLIAEHAAHGALELLGNDQADTLDGAGQITQILYKVVEQLMILT